MLLNSTQHYCHICRYREATRTDKSNSRVLEQTSQIRGYSNRQVKFEGTRTDKSNSRLLEQTSQILGYSNRLVKSENIRGYSNRKGEIREHSRATLTDKVKFESIQNLRTFEGYSDRQVKLEGTFEQKRSNLRTFEGTRTESKI